MRRVLLLIAAAALGFVGFFAPNAWAGNPHFVHDIGVSRAGDSLTVSGTETGLGNETQVDIQLTANAQCINPGQHHPKADNKEALAAAGTFPVQNGRADFTLTVTATFQPNCSPPMTVVFTNIVISDVAHNLSVSVPGTF